MKKINILFFCLSFLTFPSIILHADETSVQQQALKEISGELLSVDPVLKTIVIKYLLDSQSKEFEAELFIITAETKIVKQGAEVSFSNVSVGDSGTFNFSLDSAGNKNLSSINLN